MTRTYVRVTPDLEAKVLAARTRNPLDDHAALAEATGVPTRTVKYILLDLPRLRRMGSDETKAEGSLKQRIMWVLEEMDMQNVAELRRILGRADDEHNIVHVLHSLRKEGKIEFANSAGDKREPTGIKLTPRGRGAGLKQNGESKAEAPAVQVEAPTLTDVQPEPEPVRAKPEGSALYPILTELLGREQRRVDGDPKAMAYINAATAIEHVDPEAAASLMAKAEVFAIPYPTPIEAEYLAFARARDIEAEYDRLKDPA